MLFDWFVLSLKYMFIQLVFVRNAYGGVYYLLSSVLNMFALLEMLVTFYLKNMPKLLYGELKHVLHYTKIFTVAHLNTVLLVFVKCCCENIFSGVSYVNKNDMKNNIMDCLAPEVLAKSCLSNNNFTGFICEVGNCNTDNGTPKSFC